jgi:molybdopterin-guanine dinucleotide biosynthesis protein A
VVIPKLSFSAILLAGGDSKRMGMNKAFLKLGKERLIDIAFRKLDNLFSEVVIVADRWQELSYLPARFTGDLFKNGQKCALRGLHAGLSLSNSPSSFVMGCDMPFLSLSLIRYMSRFATDFDVVVPRLGEYHQPLFAFYKKSILGIITQRLEEKKLRLTGLYPYLNIKEIGEETVKHFDPQMLSFYNVNTQENYHRAKKLYNLPDSCFTLQKRRDETNNSSGEGANLCRRNY